jgi:multisubunit Na+/H+ antiporter MnhC subunit
MNAATLFGLSGAALVGIGLYGLVTNPEPLRKILAFNLLGSGVFLVFGVVSRRAAASGLGAGSGVVGFDSAHASGATSRSAASSRPPPHR